MQKLEITSVFLILLVALSPAYGFLYFQLALTWPPCFCNTRDCLYKTIPRNFTIHGLWPDIWPGPLVNCKRKYEFTLIEGEKIDILDKRWPQLEAKSDKGKEEQRFWRSQYNKHGACCNNKYTKEAYFDLAIKLKDRFDDLKILDDHGISPGNKYVSKTFQDAIRTVTGQPPRLTCIKNSQGLELSEVIICYDPDGKNVIDCINPGSCFNKGVNSREIVFFRNM